jgi:hypothetical protein
VPHSTWLRSPRLALVCVALLVLAAAASAASEPPCPDGPFDAAALPHLCAPVHGAPADVDTLTVRAVDRTPLGTLTLRPPTEPSGVRDLVGTLPDLAGKPSLVPADDASLWPCPVQVDDRAARIAPVSIAPADGGASLIISDRPPSDDEPFEAVTLLFVYADRSVRIDATCDIEERPLHVALSLTEGWNVIVSEMIGAPGERGMVTLRTATADDLARVSWYWSVHPHGTREEPPTVRPVAPPERR